MSRKGGTRKLLAFVTLAEGATGLILFAYPPIIVRLLFGRVVESTGSIMGRLAGLCLIALAVACWPKGQSQRGFYGMLSWSVLAALYLSVLGGTGKAGILLWPAVAVHAGLSILLVWTEWRQRSASVGTQSIGS